MSLKRAIIVQRVLQQADEAVKRLAQIRQRQAEQAANSVPKQPEEHRAGKTEER